MQTRRFSSTLLPKMSIYLNEMLRGSWIGRRGAIESFRTFPDSVEVCEDESLMDDRRSENALKITCIFLNEV